MPAHQSNCWQGNIHRRTIIQNLLAFAAILFAATFADADDKVVRIGTMSGPDAQIGSGVAQAATREGLNVKVIEFDDYVQPNSRLKISRAVRESDCGAGAGSQSAEGEEIGLGV
jgi:hypothetical protein